MALLLLFTQIAFMTRMVTAATLYRPGEHNQAAWELVNDGAETKRPTLHYSPRAWGVTPAYGKKKLRGSNAAVEFIKAIGGAAQIGYELSIAHPGARIGLTVAGNSGRPGGAVGRMDGWGVERSQVHGNHSTQEEDIVSNWLITESDEQMENIRNQYTRQDHMNFLFSNTIGGLWGMLNPNSKSTKTIQGVDYTKTANPENFGDAWIVQNALMSNKVLHKGRVWFDKYNKFRCDLVFVSGPNAGAKQSAKGSTTRTMNSAAEQDWDTFEMMVVVTLRTALDAMIVDDIDIPVLGLVSAGLYAGWWKDWLLQKYTSTTGQKRTYFMDLVDTILNEPVGPRGEKRGQYFDRVILAGIRNPQKAKY